LKKYIELVISKNLCRDARSTKYKPTADVSYLVYTLAVGSESVPVEMLPLNAPVRCTVRPFNDCQTDA